MISGIFLVNLLAAFQHLVADRAEVSLDGTADIAGNVGVIDDCIDSHENCAGWVCTASCNIPHNDSNILHSKL